MAMPNQAALTALDLARTALYSHTATRAMVEAQNVALAEMQSEINYLKSVVQTLVAGQVQFSPDAGFSADYDLAEPLDIDASAELGTWPSAHEIESAIQDAAWQYGKASAIELAHQLARDCMSSGDVEDLALTIAQELDADAGWELQGNSGHEALYRYTETCRFTEFKSLSQLPPDCSAAHRERMRLYLVNESIKHNGYYSRETVARRNFARAHSKA